MAGTAPTFLRICHHHRRAADPRADRRLARRSAQLAFADLPDDVVGIAQLCVLDWLGVTLAGCHERGPTTLLDLQQPMVGDSGVTVLRHPDVRRTVDAAALVNGQAHM
jgi:2-methylcitrate dehydratase PrpD